jgi:hypothetical protein
MTVWNISLNSWVIQDGNYPNFKKGQTAEFALYFHANKDLINVGAGDLQVAFIKDCKYTVTAKVAYVGDECWIIDFGLLAYSDNHPPKGIKVGSVFSAEIWLEIDYYFYFEFLSKNDNVPPMIYTWNVQKIFQQTAPFIKRISTRPGTLFGKEVLVRDPAKIGYREIESTDAWKDDNGSAEYIMTCEKIMTPEKRKSATASYS